jgi:glycosyltransferase involved in cell wall biosynthesis
LISVTGRRHLNADEPHVSIIIPCYNYGRFLSEAIESALEQTHVPLEVIVIDDGSTDDSYEVASRFVPAVEVISQPNMGLIAVLNRGLREAAGEFFVILSADDALRPSYVETLLGALLRQPGAAYAYSAMEYFGARSGVFPAKPFSPALLLAGNYINATALTRRADALEVGGFHSNPENAWEDWDFWLRLLESGKYGVAVPDPLLCYRRHETTSRNPPSRRKALQALNAVRAAHPHLYGRRPRGLREALLLATLVTGRLLRCRRCLRHLDRAWGFPAGGRLVDGSL